jgi:hypothetical protein
MSRRSYGCVFMSMLMATGSLVSSARAATVTKQVLVNFSGSLAGTTYTLGPGEIDTSASFKANGGATVSGGVADIPGNTNDASGFFFNSTALGNLRTQNWITEALMSLDVPVASQPNVTQPFNHFLDVQGDLFYRFDSDPKVTRFGYWDGATEPNQVTANPSAGAYSHVALVWNSGSRTLSAYINGASQGSVSAANPFEVPSPNVGYGFFSRFLNRAIDGKLNAVAFSTFTGMFNPGADFQLPVVPEPSSAVLLTIALSMLPGWFTRKR